MEKKPEVCVFYDGKCRVCSAEIAHYQKKDKEKEVQFIDITDKNFDAQRYGIENSDFQKNMHVQVNGKTHRGVDAFIAIWENLPGFAILAKIFRNPVMYFFARQGYKVFAAIRPWLPRKKD